MSLKDWWEQAKEWIFTAIRLGAISVPYLGAWAYIGVTLPQLGPLGIAAAGTLFVIHVVLLFFSNEWGFRLFYCVFVGTSICRWWRLGHWWDIALALLGATWGVAFFRKRKPTLKGPAPPQIPDPDIAARDLFVGHDLAASLDPEAPRLLRELAGGKFPKKAEHRAFHAPAAPERNPVDCTVFAPDRVERHQTVLLQVFLHAPLDRKRAEATARKFDPETKERGHRSLVMDAPIGTTFAFDVEIEGFVFNQRIDTLLWTGRPQAASFNFEVPKGCRWGQHPGTVWISKEGTPIGRISFQIEVVRDAQGARKRPVGEEARHYRTCFCSYSSLDRAEMLRRAQGLRAAGLETFIDVLKLRPGDIWNPKIFGAIDESDLFIVIWSKNARDSKWVKKESRYALKRYKQHRSPDFRPIPVEGPPIASVPRGLRAYHFNDELLSLIRAAELEMQENEKVKTEEQKPGE
jgi:hypothetical protein